MIPVTVAFELPPLGHEIATLRGVQDWLADRGLFTISANELRNRFGNPLLQNADFPWLDHWGPRDTLLVPFRYKVNPKTFEPNSAEYWFHFSMVDEALLFKLTFGGK